MLGREPGSREGRAARIRASDHERRPGQCHGRSRRDARAREARVRLADLFVLDGVTGKTVNVTGQEGAATDPVYSPNGDWLLYERGDGAESWLARGDGTAGRRGRW